MSTRKAFNPLAVICIWLEQVCNAKDTFLLVFCDVRHDGYHEHNSHELDCKLAPAIACMWRNTVLGADYRFQLLPWGGLPLPTIALRTTAVYRFQLRPWSGLPFSTIAQRTKMALPSPADDRFETYNIA